METQVRIPIRPFKDYTVICDNLSGNCNLGYACDGCPYNKFKLKPKGFVFR